MPPKPDWIPMRWPGGSFWSSPASLEIVKGTPINCLVLPWNASANTALSPLLDAGRRAGLSFAGWLDPGADKQKAAASASAAGLAAVAAESSPGAMAPVWIPVAERAKLPWDSAAPALVTTEGAWPSVKASSHGGDSADAGPTGLPWIDSNGWYVRLARALAPSKAFWLAIDLPKQTAFLRPNSYMLAVADSEAFGARWLLSLDGTFAGGIASGNAQSLASWKSIARAIGFFERHKEWRSYHAAAVLAVLSDFRGDNEFLSGEALNLLGRRQLPCLILEKSRALSAPFEGLKAILYIDPQPPAAELRKKLLAFARAGGLVICRPSSQLADGGAPSGQEHPRFEVKAFGQGRVAVAKQDFSDPYVLAADAHILLSRRHDLYRVWNSGAAGTHYTVSADGRKAVLHILNYSGGPTDHVAVRFQQPYRQARLWTFERDEPAPVNILAEGSSTDCQLPAILVYAALELEA